MSIHYTAPTVAGTGPLPGTRFLALDLRALTGCTTGVYNRRCVVQCGAPVAVGAHTCATGHEISHHAVADACDVMSYDPVIHRMVIDWALGREGRAHEVVEVISGFSPLGRPGRWTPDSGWRVYTGSSPSDHRDHIHLTQSYEAALRTTHPLIAGDDEMAKYELYTPEGFFDALAVGPGVPFHVTEPDSVQELVDKGKVVNADGTVVAKGTPYASVCQELSVPLWTNMAGFAPGSPR